MTHIPPRRPVRPMNELQRDPVPEKISISDRRLGNIPHPHDKNQRVIGFVMNESEIETQGLFENELQEQCIQYLLLLGYKVRK